jgi:hypothetical protein
MTTRRKPAQTKKPQRSETWETCKEFLNIPEAWMMEFEDGWYAYYGDEKPIGVRGRLVCLLWRRKADRTPSRRSTRQPVPA